jgi:hypothetical protein
MSHPDEPDRDIRQHLDMEESGPLRGDDILHRHGRASRSSPEDQMFENFQVDMSEENREGDEMSGDDHSSGLQGGDSELNPQPVAQSGLPGERTDDEERIVDELDRHRAS